MQLGRRVLPPPLRWSRISCRRTRSPRRREYASPVEQRPFITKPTWRIPTTRRPESLDIQFRSASRSPVSFDRFLPRTRESQYSRERGRFFPAAGRVKRGIHRRDPAPTAGGVHPSGAYLWFHSSWTGPNDGVRTCGSRYSDLRQDGDPEGAKPGPRNRSAVLGEGRKPASQGTKLRGPGDPGGLRDDRAARVLFQGGGGPAAIGMIERSVACDGGVQEKFSK